VSTAALAGLALFFPLVMLMQVLSAGAMGGGVSSALGGLARRVGHWPTLPVEEIDERAEHGVGCFRHQRMPGGRELHDLRAGHGLREG